jgi:hypothetical protein
MAKLCFVGRQKTYFHRANLLKIGFGNINYYNLTARLAYCERLVCCTEIEVLQLNGIKICARGCLLSMHHKFADSD